MKRWLFRSLRHAEFADCVVIRFPVIPGWTRNLLVSISYFIYKEILNQKKRMSEALNRMTRVLNRSFFSCDTVCKFGMT